jgi:hypothetical protein
MAYHRDAAQTNAKRVASMSEFTQSASAGLPALTPDDGMSWSANLYLVDPGIGSGWMVPVSQVLSVEGDYLFRTKYDGDHHADFKAFWKEPC